SGKGTGLGLATVYGIVKQTGGSIWLSSAPGRGTSFDIYYPVESAEPTTRITGPSAAVAPGHESILLVEDEEAIRLVARRVLVHAGYTVHLAEHGAAALDFMAQHDGPIHLLLTDLVMPGMTGTQLAHELVTRHPALKV